MAVPQVSVLDAVAGIPDGASVALGRPAALALVEELARQGRRDLHLIGVPTGGRAVELLIAAGCAASLESSGVDLGEEGQAPAFARAVEEGRLRMIDSSCPAMLAALQAGASGVSFAPVPGLLGSDLLARRPDFRVIDDPFRAGGSVVLVPAIVPEHALLRGRRADPDGNVVIGIEYDDRLVARAAGHVIYSVEAVREDATRTLSAGEQVVPAALIDALVLVPD
ncbi:MAG TPA: CoA-transferase [Candidatus Dormibacteraeota bacterium]|nr:CoA-transferase [Candidatus Dormibacteraeota bacterium]